MIFAAETATTAADIWAFAGKILAVIACLGLGVVAAFLAGLMLIILVVMFRLSCQPEKIRLNWPADVPRGPIGEGEAP
jgi:hypothetical protein